jgi:tRNA pseudouridine55 synthase
LAADLGRALGTVAHIEALRRTSSGPFALSQAIAPETLERLCADGAAWPLVGLTEALGHLPAVPVNAEAATALRQGKAVSWDEIAAPRAERIRVLRPDGTLLAVATRGEDGRVRTLRVFNEEREAD